MSNIRIPSYLSKSRHGIYYVRVVTPKALKVAYPQLPVEMRKSLNTRCLREAAIRSRKLVLDFQLLLPEAVGAMTKKQEDFSGQFTIDVHPDGLVSYKFEEGDTAEKVKEYIHLMQITGQLSNHAKLI